MSGVYLELCPHTLNAEWIWQGLRLHKCLYLGNTFHVNVHLILALFMTTFIPKDIVHSNLKFKTNSVIIKVKCISTNIFVDCRSAEAHRLLVNATVYVFDSHLGEMDCLFIRDTSRRRKVV